MIAFINNLLFSILPNNMPVEDKLRLYFVIANFNYICYRIIREVEKNFLHFNYIFTADGKPVFDIEIDQPLFISNPKEYEVGTEEI